MLQAAPYEPVAEVVDVARDAPPAGDQQPGAARRLQALQPPNLGTPHLKSQISGFLEGFSVQGLNHARATEPEVLDFESLERWMKP